MKVLKMLFVLSIAFFLVSSVAVAGDFDWARDFNIEAEANPSGFRARNNGEGIALVNATL
jgi:hypothetical protein